MQIAALLTPSPATCFILLSLHMLWVLISPRDLSLDSSCGISAPSISHSAPLSAVPIYTSTIYLCCLSRSRQ